MTLRDAWGGGRSAGGIGPAFTVQYGPIGPLGLRYPIHARGSRMRAGKDRVRVEAVRGPVSRGGVRIEPGDLLLGYANGVLAIPAAVLDYARTINAAEQAVRDRVNSRR